MRNGTNMNKAGCTANTSCGRVGRGGNAHSPTSQLDDPRRINGRTDGWTDKASYRVACPQLKRGKRKKKKEEKERRKRKKERNQQTKKQKTNKKKRNKERKKERKKERRKEKK